MVFKRRFLVYGKANTLKMGLFTDSIVNILLNFIDCFIDVLPYIAKRLPATKLQTIVKFPSFNLCMILHEWQAGIHKKETCVYKRCLKLKGKINPCGVAEMPATIIKMRISLIKQFFILGSDFVAMEFLISNLTSDRCPSLH